MNSEWLGNVGRKPSRVFFSLARPNHPMGYSYFGGNAESLRKNRTDEELSQRLKEYHASHYSSNLMALVVTSKEIPLDVLEKEVASNFGAIKDLGLQHPELKIL